MEKQNGMLSMPRRPGSVCGSFHGSACVTLCCLKRVFHRALLYLIYCAVCTLDSASDRWPNAEGDAAPTAASSHSSADTHVTECTQTLVCSAGEVLWCMCARRPSLLDCLYLIVGADVNLNRGFDCNLCVRAAVCLWFIPARWLHDS